MYKLYCVEFECFQERFPSVLKINVGGVLFTTHLSTLLKYSDSMLSTMFNGRHVISRDDDGNPFIDANPKYFEHILEYLRHETIPPFDVTLCMYHQACYYNIGPLIEELRSTPGVTKELIREAYRDQFPEYSNVLHQIIELATENALKMHDGEKGRVSLHLFRQPFVPVKKDFWEEHKCIVSEANLVVGPWEGPASPEALRKCLKHDLLEKGFKVVEEAECVRRCDYFSGDAEDLWNGTVEYCPKTNIMLTFLF